MSLSARLILGVLVSLACTGLLGFAALSGMQGMRTHFDAASQQHVQLRALYEIGHRAATTRQLLSSPTPDMRVVESNLTIAMSTLERLTAHESVPGAQAPDPALRDRLGALESRLRAAAERAIADANPAALSDEMNGALEHVAALAGDAQSGIIENRRLASAKLTSTIRFMLLLFGVTAFAVALSGLALRRSVMRPVRSLGRAVDQLARADFNHRIPAQGDREFRSLIDHFNRMSAEIESLHESMQRQVESKSRQLVRSERLASVGCLAAGLAHEINNPLGIIAGYAESTQRRLAAADSRIDDPALCARIDEVLVTICDEAYRCSAITGELLGMARPSETVHHPVRLAPIVQRAVALARGLSLARDRTINLRIEDPADAAFVSADETQLLQTLINLVTNALEACEAGDGRVEVSIQQRAGEAIIEVYDNGRGMTPEALAHAFDPFYTDKPRRAIAGAGLGLSVSHEIARRHNGRLYAHSDGPGRGATMTLVLPLHVEQNSETPRRAHA